MNVKMKLSASERKSGMDLRNFTVVPIKGAANRRRMGGAAMLVKKEPNPERQKAAKKRLGVAIDHLFRAAGELNHAMADLSTIVGLKGKYRALQHVFDDLQEVKLSLGEAQHNDENPYEIDHDPTPQELKCGHGPKHGCGRGKR